VFKNIAYCYKAGIVQVAMRNTMVSKYIVLDARYWMLDERCGS